MIDNSNTAQTPGPAQNERGVTTVDAMMIAHTSSVFFLPGTITELRILNTLRDGTISGYFDNGQDFTRAAGAWSGKAPAVYCTLNPCNPALLARAANRLQTRVKTTTADHDIVRRVWLPLDFDPVRPAGISSTDAEHTAALERAASCVTWLRAHGWPDPVTADSGNGGHALYRIELPNDDAGRTLLKTCLEVLALYFTDSEVALDTGVFNAARIWKVYGTLACKGDNHPERPHRLAQLLDVPAPLAPVTREQLEALAALLPAAPTTTPRRGGTVPHTFDIRQWIASHGMPVVKEGPWQQTGYRWELNPCPWDSAHTNGAAFIVQLPNGAIGAGCHHNGCQGNDWEALRRAYEPGWTPYRERSHAAVGAQGLSSLNSLSSQPEEESAELVLASAEELNSLFSLNSQDKLSLRQEAFHGVVGHLVGLISPHTEADPAALLIQFLVYFGGVVGRRSYYLVGATRHYPNLFAILVGATSKARKGSAYDHIDAVMRSVDPFWTHDNIISGCGSGEGLIHAVRDPVIKRESIKVKGKVTGYEDVETDKGVTDKRLLVHEPEFASVLKVASREGNILSMTLRQAWDSGTLHNTVKTTPQRATNAHIALLGHITTDELTKLLTTTEAANGFGNRFLWIAVHRTKLLPDGGALSGVDMQAVVERLRKAHRATQGVTQMHRDAQATRAWHAVYPTLSADQPGLAGSMLARGEPQVLRLSMLYALLDGSATIRVEHLSAALAVWEYAEASVRKVFGTTTGNKEADTLREALKWAEAGKMTKTDIIREVFHGHIKAHDLNTAIRLLAEEGMITRQFAPSTGGRRKEYVCYGGSSSSSTLTRARAGYIELVELSMQGEPPATTMTEECELSEKSELSLFEGVNTRSGENHQPCEESELSEESPSQQEKTPHAPAPPCLHAETRAQRIEDGSILVRCATCHRVVRVTDPERSN